MISKMESQNGLSPFRNLTLSIACENQPILNGEDFSPEAQLQGFGLWKPRSLQNPCFY